MAQDQVPTGKIERASKFLKTGVKVGANYVKHYGGKALGSDATKDSLDRANAETIFQSFAELKGSALKVAQMLSMDTANLSSAFTQVMQKAQYSVPPMSAPLAVQTFTKSVGKSPEKVFERFYPNAMKAASMGQVHEAWVDGKKLAVKIQYPGVADSIKSDMKLVSGLAGQVLNLPMVELNPYLKEVENRLVEESDYGLELRTSIQFAEECKELDGIVFPRYYPEYSSDRVITMEWIEGKHMKDWLATNPSEEVRLKAANNLYNYYEFQIHKLRKLNSDPHPGNFLFRPDGSIGVLDFGCTKQLTDVLYTNYFEMAKPDLFRDQAFAEETLLKLEILRPTDSKEKRAELIELFSRLISTVATPYHIGHFNFNQPEFHQRINDIGIEVAKLRELRGSKDFLFINRTYYGLFALFAQLDVEINTTCQYGDFLAKTEAVLA
jgi:predicted unusual protein kinase regulating ubiquinone biosynthesis (AarF/ABC1/UbiB family)